MKIKNIVAAIFAALSLLGFVSSSSAQTINGPFVSKQALLSYWNNIGDDGSHTVWLNGYPIWGAGSFSPVTRHPYFQCNDGLIRSDCNSIKGPFLSQQAALNSAHSWVPNSDFMWVALDGNTIYWLGFGPASGSLWYKTCNAQMPYIVLESTTFSGVTGMNCLPQL